MLGLPNRSSVFNPIEQPKGILRHKLPILQRISRQTVRMQPYEPIPGYWIVTAGKSSCPMSHRSRSSPIFLCSISISSTTHYLSTSIPLSIAHLPCTTTTIFSQSHCSCTTSKRESTATNWPNYKQCSRTDRIHHRWSASPTRQQYDSPSHCGIPGTLLRNHFQGQIT